MDKNKVLAEELLRAPLDDAIINAVGELCRARPDLAGAVIALNDRATRYKADYEEMLRYIRGDYRA